eukprot:TRINITY_DN18780_c0_g1_i1.p1 TRINITY_DN18780_c0_g1~~TRINITY_DN18780_c0_g1_i1.p1  ORF type:complete len:1223 (+),score=241.48 TRINITY_DN18780_c0_g1_i1:57-3725(+)
MKDACGGPGGCSPVTPRRRTRRPSSGPAQPDVEPQPEGEEDASASETAEESGAEGDGETGNAYTPRLTPRLSKSQKDLVAANLALKLEVEQLRKSVRRQSVHHSSVKERRGSVGSRRLSSSSTSEANFASTMGGVLQENAMLHEQVTALMRQRDAYEFEAKQAMERADSVAEGNVVAELQDIGGLEANFQAALKAVEQAPKPLRKIVHKLIRKADAERTQTMHEAEQAQKWLRMQVDASHKRLYQCRKEIQDLQGQLAEKDEYRQVQETEQAHLQDCLDEAHNLLSYERERCQTLREEVEHVTQELQAGRLGHVMDVSRIHRHSPRLPGCDNPSMEVFFGDSDEEHTPRATSGSPRTSLEGSPFATFELSERCAQLRLDLARAVELETKATAENQRLNVLVVEGTQERTELRDALATAEKRQHEAHDSQQSLLRDLVNSSNKMVMMEQSCDELKEELASAREAGRQACSRSVALSVKCTRLQEVARRCEGLEQECEELHETLDAAVDREAQVRHNLFEKTELLASVEQAFEAHRRSVQGDEEARAEAARRLQECEVLRSELVAGTSAQQLEAALRVNLQQRLESSEKSEKEEAASATSLKAELENLREQHRTAILALEATAAQQSDRFACLMREVEDLHGECGQLSSQLAAAKMAEQKAITEASAAKAQLVAAKGNASLDPCAAAKEVESMRREVERMQKQLVVTERSEKQAKKTCTELVDTARKVDDLQLELDRVRSQLATARRSEQRAQQAAQEANARADAMSATAYNSELEQEVVRLQLALADASRKSAGRLDMVMERDKEIRDLKDEVRVSKLAAEAARRAMETRPRARSLGSRSRGRSPRGSGSVDSQRKNSLPPVQEEFSIRTIRSSITSMSSLGFSDLTTRSQSGMESDDKHEEDEEPVEPPRRLFAALASSDDEPSEANFNGRGLSFLAVEKNLEPNGSRSPGPESSFTTVWAGESLVSKISSVNCCPVEAEAAAEKPSWWMAGPRQTDSSPRLSRQSSVSGRRGRSSCSFIEQSPASDGLADLVGCLDGARRSCSPQHRQRDGLKVPSRGRRSLPGSSREVSPRSATSGADEEMAPSSRGTGRNSADATHQAESTSSRRESVSSAWSRSSASSAASSVKSVDSDQEPVNEHPLAAKLRILRNEGAKVRKSLRNRDSTRMNKLRAAVAVAATCTAFHSNRENTAEASDKSTRRSGSHTVRPPQRPEKSPRVSAP